MILSFYSIVRKNILTIKKMNGHSVHLRKESIMDKRDYIDLIVVVDELENMDKAFQLLTGFGHSEGTYKDLDKVYDVLQRHSKYYNEEDEHMNDVFFIILSDKSKSAEERANLLIKEEWTQCPFVKKEGKV